MLATTVAASGALLLGGTRLAQSGAANLDQLLKERRYLELESALQSSAKLPEADRTFFEGVMANRRNRIGDSIHLLQPLLPSLSRTDKARAVTALGTLADDYEKSFRYADAANTYADLSKHFRRYMDEQERERADREAARWSLLRDVPPQSAEVETPFTISTTTDQVGLAEVSVQLGKLQQSLILDTGANLSAISLSLAQKLGLKLSSSVATSRGIAGPRMRVHTAVIPEMRLGKATLRNVAVIVVNDQDLTVPQLRYRIPGSIGFPVLSALGRITFFADGRFGVGLRPVGEAASGEKNLFLQRLTPIVAAEVGGTQALFTVDTGAAGSFFTVQYYREHKMDFRSQAAEDFDLMGAGGERTYSAYLTPRLNIRIGGACAVLKDIPVLAETRGMSDDQFYGNIGQDILAMFTSYTFDFQNMSFSAEGNTCAQASKR